MIPIVLASASPRRRGLLSAIGIAFEVHVSNATETLEGDPKEVVTTNAVVKRDDVARILTHPAIVVAGDTIVVLDDTIMGKPVDLAEASAMLERLSGRTHTVMTGLAIVNTETGQHAARVESTDVTFRELSAQDIATFVEAVQPLDRAGAYTGDGPGSLLVTRYDGSYENVLGLPVVLLDTLFQEIGDSLFSRVNPAETRYL